MNRRPSRNFADLDGVRQVDPGFGFSPDVAHARRSGQIEF
jgi:hypothetical protein